MQRKQQFLAFTAVAVAMLASKLDLEAVSADVDNQLYTSKEANVRIGIPRGWRASDNPSYPGALVWMRRSRPPGAMLLTSERVSDKDFCTWSTRCRRSSTDLTEQYTCALAENLTTAGFTVGPIQRARTNGSLTPRWIEYDDGQRWLRQAVVTVGNRAHTLVLAAPSPGERSAHARSFDQALISLRPLTGASTSDVAGEALADADVREVEDAVDAPVAPAEAIDVPVVDGTTPDAGTVTVKALPPTAAELTRRCAS